MPYTLWSRGILIGETDFALGDSNSRHLAGVFQPAVSGMLVLPALTAMAPALFDLRAMMQRERISDDDTDTDPDRVLEIFEHSPEGRRIIASAKEIEQLELRSPSGRILELESILVSDLTELSRFGIDARGAKKKRKKAKKRRKQRDPVRYLISATFALRPGALLA